jgi:hypothetical protein
MRGVPQERHLARTQVKETQMSEGSSSGGNGGLYLIVGGLVVAVGLGFFAYSNGYLGGHGSRTTIEQTTSSAPSGTTTTTTTTEKSKP